jgi:ferric-dicitrate binding protein FerR (iron transport regulator)
MSDRDDYLWDKSGPVDPDVAELERALGELRFERPLDPAVLPAKRRHALVGALALAASVAIVGWLAWRNEPQAPTLEASLAGIGDKATQALPPGWPLEVRTGAAVCDGEPVVGHGRLRVGGWIETDANTEARLRIPGLGRVDVMPGTRLHLVGSSREEHRLELVRGRIHAVVSAPPRVFVVDTPAARAIDLGCEYDLSVEADGGTLLEVALGWVALKAPEPADAIVYVPEGSLARVHPGGVLGLPHRSDAPEAYRDKVLRAERGEGIAALTAASGPGDHVTLWHLLLRHGGEPDTARAVVERLRATGAAAAIDEEAVLRGDHEAVVRYGADLDIVPFGVAPEPLPPPRDPLWKND